jgi:ABC-type nickel/cobalt efflux system permease component RcnA
VSCGVGGAVERGGTAPHRVWTALIVAFSVGLAAVLVGVGLLLVSARGAVQRWNGEGRWLAYLPFLSPLVMTPLGVVIAVRSLLSTGLLSGFSF